MKHFYKIAALVLILIIGVSTAGAKKKKSGRVFYDSKSWIVNVFGNTEEYMSQTIRHKIESFPMAIPMFSASFDKDGLPDEKACEDEARRLTEEGYGKKIVDILTLNGESENTLRRLAIANVQKGDIELANENMRVSEGDNASNLLAEDYLPILMHNYIVAEVPYTYKVKDKNDNYVEKTGYWPVLFKVDIDKEQAFDIMSCLGDKERYDKLHFNVSLASRQKYYNDIIEEVPDMAVRGVLTQRAPARINIGSDAGISKGDLISFFGQRVDKEGNMYSKRISRARVSAVWPEYSQVNFEAKMSGNRKNGDVAVKTPDSKSWFGLLATWSPHIWGGKLLFDNLSGFTRAGIIHHFLMDLGFSMSDCPNNKYLYYAPDKDANCLKSPMFWNIGMGYGLSKTFVGFFDFMPFFIVQYEGGFMPGNKKLLKEYEAAGEDYGKQAKTIYGNFLHVPVGLRFSFNIGYPTRLAIEAGWAFNVAFDNNAKGIKEAMKTFGGKRDGIFINLGLTF